MEEHRMPDTGCRMLVAGLQDCRNTARRSQKTEDRRNIRLRNHFRYFGIWILMFGISASGCVSESTRTYGKEVVVTYAELTLMYEKEKMVNKLDDSSYQVKVAEFFRKKGIEEKVFRKGVEEFSRDEGVWKLFIQDVSAVMDSLKTLKN